MENTAQPAQVKNENRDKTTGIIAYLTIIGLIAAFVLNKDSKDEFASYHIRQSLGLCLTGVALAVIGLVPFIGWLVSIFGTICLVVLWILGLINALNGLEKPVPILGTKYIEWFKNV
jgi:uncharacterized membrane protein